MLRYLTALRPVYVPFREAEPVQLHDAWYRATAAKRHPDGQRDDGFTAYGRLPLAESGFLLEKLHILNFVVEIIIKKFRRFLVFLPETSKSGV